MSIWNLWRGCKKCSDGCKYCYIHKGDFKRNVNTNDIVKTKDFSKPIEKLKNGNYKIKSGTVYLCFSSDFLIEEADIWRDTCWEIIKELKEILKQDKNLLAVFSGHQHWTRKTIKAGITYYVVGSLTENINDDGIPDGVYFEIDLEENKLNVIEHHIRL